MSDCFFVPVCGDGVRHDPEECDVGLSGDGCTNCVIDDGYTCTENSDGLSTCVLTPACGNGIIETGEECDNFNEEGCTNCVIDDNYSCFVHFQGFSVCVLCGDRQVEGFE